MNTSHQITVIIADDHPIVRKGLCNVIAEDKDLRILYEAGDGESAFDAIKKYQPRVGVLDVEMPKMTGLDVVQQVRRCELPIALIILTAYDDTGIFTKAMNLGVDGYILKDSASMDIVRGIKRVAQGDYFISPSLTSNVLHKSKTMDSSVDQHLGLQLLTQSERRILQLVAQDKSTKEIADELSISPKTVAHHRANISTKLHLNGSFSLLRFALEHKSIL